MDPHPSRAKQVKSVAIVSSGNFLEMFDFMIFGYYASAISKTFFPAGNEFAALMLTALLGMGLYLAVVLLERLLSWSPSDAPIGGL